MRRRVSRRGRSFAALRTGRARRRPPTGTANWTQERYVFPTAALLALWGLRALLPRPLLRPAAALTLAALAGYTLLLLTRLVLPYAFL